MAHGELRGGHLDVSSRSPACLGRASGRKMPGWVGVSVRRLSSGWPPPERMTLTLATASAWKSARPVRWAAKADFSPTTRRGKLDEEFGLVGEVGDLFATGPCACRGHASAAGWLPSLAWGWSAGRRRSAGKARHKKWQSGSCSFGDAPGQQVVVDARLARFPFEIEGRHFGFQRAAIGVEEFKQGRFAALVGGFGDAQQLCRFATARAR
jgi:hypothetical protein